MRYLTSFNTDLLETIECDVLIVGSGIAGLFTALNIDDSLKVCLISKDDLKTNNSYLAQGGVAVTFNKEDFQGHIDDTFEAGGFYNDLPAVKVLIEEGRKNVEKLIEYGVDFDKVDGEISFTREGGHSKRRIIHKKDYTGKEIIEKLIQVVKRRDNIHCYENAFLVDVLTENNSVRGSIVLMNGKENLIKTNHVVLATGGVGKLFLNSTNSSICTGDGIAVAYRAGAVIQDMEFIQFHPTPFHSKGEAFLISEAVRGEGGILRNDSGEAFMEKYHSLKDLAPRDIVSRSIIKEQELQGNKDIYLDVTHFKKGYFEKRFPSIFNYCISQNVDPRKEWIPVNPSAHYLMGGIKTDLFGRTNIEGLYSCGESARTGVQGANRLASNSLSEGLVYGKRASDTINHSGKFDIKKCFIKNEKLNEEILEYKNDVIVLKTIMDKSVNILRTRTKLLSAKHRIRMLEDKYGHIYSYEKEFLEFKNMITVSSLIIEMALKRKESLGSHYLEKNDE
ncbi:MAG: L-aspartate oxidase [Bacillota bacterium]|nr:L-aspartate oxidase [Bacillota bacterium]